MRSAIDERFLVREIRATGIANGSRERALSHPDRQALATRIERMANVHNARLRSENPEIAAGVDDAAAHSGTDERLRRAINGKALGNSAKIDQQRAAEMHPSARRENDVPPVSTEMARTFLRQETPVAHTRRNGDIERAARFARKISGGQ